MANRIEGVTEKLEKAAMHEFLEKGYNGASLRTISENAGTTPRSIYTRYNDKEGLFAALVQDTADGIREMFERCMQRYHEKPVELQKNLFHDEQFDREYEGYIHSILDYIYSHWDECSLLVCHCEDTRFSGFLDELVSLDEKYTLLYIECTGNDVLASGRAKPQLIHLLCSSFIHGFFEIVRHNMKRKDAAEFVSQLQDFYTCGWDHLFHP